MRAVFSRVTLAGVVMGCAVAGCVHSPAPSYCPNIQAYARSWLALNDEERALLDQNGFVIADAGDPFGDTFLGGWPRIFQADLPLYVTADALLHAIHRSYDAILKDIELSILVPATGQKLASIRKRDAMWISLPRWRSAFCRAQRSTRWWMQTGKRSPDGSRRRAPPRGSTRRRCSAANVSSTSRNSPRGDTIATRACSLDTSGR